MVVAPTFAPGASSPGPVAVDTVALDCVALDGTDGVALDGAALDGAALDPEPQPDRAPVTNIPLVHIAAHAAKMAWRGLRLRFDMSLPFGQSSRSRVARVLATGSDVFAVRHRTDHRCRCKTAQMDLPTYAMASEVIGKQVSSTDPRAGQSRIAHT